jgi:hypothetical protein
VARRLRTGILVASVAAALAAGSLVTAYNANADTTLCDQYAITTAGQYLVQNNRWGTSATHCINVTSNGFRITQQDGVGNTGGAPVSYPSMIYGCHYTNCSPGTVLPKQLSAITSVNSSISYSYVSGATYDAAYDIWLDPTPKTNGVNQTEIMIWFNKQGAIQPVGTATGNVTLGGRSWQVWTGNNGSNNVVSYVAPSAIGSWNFSVLDFINDTKNRGYATNSWYLTSIQAGFEPWRGGVGLAVNSFSASVNSSTGGLTPTATRTPTPTTPAATTPGGGTTGGCRVSYQTNVWAGGFTANVTVNNTASTPVNGWGLAFTLPAGQAVTSSWNTALSGSAGSVTARNAAYNGTIPANGSQSFGFQGTYSGGFTPPSTFTLNGTRCATA